MSKTDVLNNAAADAINKLSAFLSESKDFVAEQAPELAQQILVYGMAKSILFIVLFFVILTLTYFAVFKWSNQKQDPYTDITPSKLLSAMIGGFGILITLVLAIDQTLVLVKIIYAPKLYLLEYVANSIK